MMLLDEIENPVLEIPVPEAAPEPAVPDVIPEAAEEVESDSEDFTYDQVVNMSARELRATCVKNGILLEEAGKLIKVPTLRTQLLTKLNLS